jgi:hypothetical protein
MRGRRRTGRWREHAFLKIAMPNAANYPDQDFLPSVP